MDAIWQRGAAEKRDGRANRAIGIGGEAVAEPATPAVRRRDNGSAVSPQHPAKILWINMAVAGDKLNHHRQEREPLRRTPEASALDGETTDHWREHRRIGMALTTAHSHAKSRGEPRRCR